MDASGSEVNCISESAAAARAEVTSTQPVPAHQSVRTTAIIERNLKLLLEGRFTGLDSSPGGETCHVKRERVLSTTQPSLLQRLSDRDSVM